jgi:two-component system, cell cycle response regulator
MNRSTGAYSLRVFGLTATQRMVLASLCKLSQNREFSYSLPDSAGFSPADIAIVDADDQEAIASWKTSSMSTRTPVVFVSARPLTDLESHQYNLVRSHLSGGLLQLLDRVAISELRSVSPLVVSDDVSVREQAPRTDAGCGTSHARALIIDDSLSVRTQMNICLEKLDIATEAAEDAQRGLDKLQERYYDLVFLDVMLPDMDGYQVCKLIKKDPRTHRVPVIMLTSKGSTINRIQGSIAGCDRYLIKPASESDVVKVVRDFVPGMPDHVSLKPV